jgi:sec-independent protein translocase protein TatC
MKTDAHPSGRVEGLLDLLESLRRPLLFLGASAIALTAAMYPLGPAVVDHLQRQTGVPLAAFGVPDIFLAYVTAAAGLAGLSLAPALAFVVLKGLRRPGSGLNRGALTGFWVAGVLLFYTGAGFCLRLTLPYGARFLMSYAATDIEPVISVIHFMRFCTLFIFGFGLVFELPLAMILAGRIGLVHRGTLRRHRPYAVLAITVASAVLTPTPDVASLLLMAAPLYLLFELGLIGMGISRT